ncbi:helicase-related protein [Pseudactinotalea sp. HY160]|uniref:helicase-related protein n=1 Tax=Pseudactinotalea sp. HY160 TaxID=2654490 RepID=UPI0018834009|nr:helicase-related protein [Pseudactinotalea sp. HY160]
MWDKATGRFELPLTDVLNDRGRPRPGVHCSDALVEAARQARQPARLIEGVSSLALASSVDAAGSAGAGAVESVGDVPDWFALALYPYQRAGAIAAAGGHRILGDQPGLGKSQPLTAPIPTPTGWTTMGELRPGDEVFARDGSVTKVLGLSPIHVKPVYSVHLSDGQVIEASGDHEWIVAPARERKAHCRSKAFGNRMRERVFAEAAALRTVGARLGEVFLPARVIAAAAGVSVPYVLATTKDFGIERRTEDRGPTKYRAQSTINTLAWRRERHYLPGGRNYLAPLERIVTTDEMRKQLRSGMYDDARNWAIRLPEAVVLPEAELPLDPYILGMWLGDGHRGGGEFTASPVPCLDGTASDQEHLIAELEHAEFRPRQTTRDPKRIGTTGLKTVLSQIGVLWDKHIPTEYLRASAEQRLALVQGLMDSDGSVVTAANCEFGQSDARIAWQMAELLRSLGIKAHVRCYEHSYRYNGGRRDAKTRYRIGFTTTQRVFRLPRKASKLPTHTRETQRWLYITDITVGEPVPMRCIRVEHPEHLYLTGGFVPTHNTRQALAAHAITGVRRLLVVSPPVALTQWQRETTASKVASRPATPQTPRAESEAVVITSKRKEPGFPDVGAVIVSDSLMASRPALLERIRAWAPDGLIVDEVHRHKTWDSARAKAVRDVAEGIDGTRIAISGTPMLANPVELASPLAITGQLGPIFGGYDAFATTYARQNHFKAWVARKKMMPQLRTVFDSRVWVRRRKEDVLDLPAKTRHDLITDVDLSGFRQAHKDVKAKVAEWVADYVDEHGKTPDDEAVTAYSRDSIGLTSMLRRAAGMAKVAPATEYITDWIAQTGTSIDEAGRTTFNRPLIVWTHHRVVSEAMATAVPAAIGGARVIIGGTDNDTRTKIVDDFQAGLVPVLVASITAAGTGITLTRSSDVLFVETDWTPALVQQAEDRAHRIGSTRPVTITTMVAPGTLDERVQKVLSDKGLLLQDLMGEGQDVSVVDFEDDESVAPAQIVADIARDVVDKAKRRTPTRRSTVRQGSGEQWAA